MSTMWSHMRRRGVLGLRLRLQILNARRVPSSPAVSQVSPDAEVLTNEAVINMATAGLGDDVILEKLNHSRCNFALSSLDLAGLKQTGMSDRLIAAMLKKERGL